MLMMVLFKEHVCMCEEPLISILMSRYTDGSWPGGSLIPDHSSLVVHTQKGPCGCVARMGVTMALIKVLLI